MQMCLLFTCALYGLKNKRYARQPIKVQLASFHMYYWCLHHTTTEYTECQGFCRRRDRHYGTLCILGRGGKGNHTPTRKHWSSINNSILSGWQGYVETLHIDSGVYREYTVTCEQIYYYSPNSFRTFQGPSVLGD